MENRSKKSVSSESAEVSLKWLKSKEGEASFNQKIQEAKSYSAELCQYMKAETNILLDHITL